jgi:hypothetical protein
MITLLISLEQFIDIRVLLIKDPNVMFRLPLEDLKLHLFFFLFLFFLLFILFFFLLFLFLLFFFLL